MSTFWSPIPGIVIECDDRDGAPQKIIVGSGRLEDIIADAINNNPDLNNARKAQLINFYRGRIP